MNEKILRIEMSEDEDYIKFLQLDIKENEEVTPCQDENQGRLIKFINNCFYWWDGYDWVPVEQEVPK